MYEGGIVKVHGRHLVVLRRGRLFTIEVGDRSLLPISWTNAFGLGTDAQDAWYGEMLVYANRIVVIGYSYRRGGTEVVLFDIDANGRMQYQATYHLSSNDYYSSRDYASRMTADGKLILYSPVSLSGMASLPSPRRWPTFAPRNRDKANKNTYARIVPATRIYYPGHDLVGTDSPILHTITTCDLKAAKFECQPTSVIGSYREVFYVSGTAVYVWITPYAWPKPRYKTSVLNRLPLGGSPLSGLANVRQPRRSDLVPGIQRFAQRARRIAGGQPLDVELRNQSGQARTAARIARRFRFGQYQTEDGSLLAYARSQRRGLVPE